MEEHGTSYNEQEQEEHKQLTGAALQLIVLMYSEIKDEIHSIPKPKLIAPRGGDSNNNILKLIADHTPPLRPSIRGFPESLIGDCTEPYEKQLTDSDVRANQARLSLGKTYARESILPLLKRGEDVLDGIPVTAYDDGGNEFPMRLKLWAEKVYVLTGGWRPFAEAHKLICHEDFVTIWVFRKVDTANLCVAIASRRLPVYQPIKKSTAAAAAAS
ncbi:Putative B3 domain-containing protein At4g03160 [Linum perenne]